MSCGRPHETDCDEVLDRLYEFIDYEMDSTNRAQIERHLAECGPCLNEYHLERIVRKLLTRSCCSEHAPEALRSRVLMQIRHVSVRVIETGD